MFKNYFILFYTEKKKIRRQLRRILKYYLLAKSSVWQKELYFISFSKTLLFQKLYNFLVARVYIYTFFQCLGQPLFYRSKSTFANFN